MSIQQVESWILRHVPPVASSAGYAGRVLLATGVGSLAVALFTIAVQRALGPPSDAASGPGIGYLLVEPYRGIFASAVLFAWAVAAVFALPVLPGRRVYASGVFVLALECVAVLVGAWIGGGASLGMVIATYPVALVASRFVPGLASPVRARKPS